MLIRSVWGVQAEATSRSLDQSMVKVRALFRKHGLSLDTLHTVHGVGYILEA